MGIIDGPRWALDRLLFLDALLQKVVSGEQRSRIEREMDLLSREAYFASPEAMRSWLIRMKRAQERS